MNLENAKILINTEISNGIFHMVLFAPKIAKMAQPGQFIMLYLNRGDLLLPRPISIFNADSDKGEIEIVYQVVGKGTKAISEMSAEIKVLGAMGNGFFTEGRNGETLNRVALIGGGIGIFPLNFLAAFLSKRNVDFHIYHGVRTKSLAYNIGMLNDERYFASDDGSLGHRGRITAHPSLLSNKYDMIFSCGPKPMLRAISDYAKSKNIPCQISVEERMACGMGTCVGCVVKVGEDYVRVCSEGPVFYSDEITCDEVFK